MREVVLLIKFSDVAQTSFKFSTWFNHPVTSSLKTNLSNKIDRRSIYLETPSYSFSGILKAAEILKVLVVPTPLSYGGSLV